MIINNTNQYDMIIYAYILNSPLLQLMLCSMLTHHSYNLNFYFLLQFIEERFKFKILEGKRDVSII